MGKKEVINHEHERLWEELTLDRKIEEEASGPPYGGFGGSYVKGHHSWYQRTHAVIYLNKDGKPHRIYGPAFVSKKHGIEKWYKDGKLHREGGPALTHKQTMIWYQNGKLHNMEGPAVIDPSGPDQYWIGGSCISKKEYKKQIANMKRKGTIK